MSLKGSLETVGLAEVLQFLASTGKTGEFQLSDQGRDGRLWLDGGSICGFEVGTSRAPFEAVFELLRFEDGIFEFSGGTRHPADLARVAGDDGEVGAALEKAQARLAEWREIVAVVPSLFHGVYLATELPCEEVTLRAPQWSMVGSIGSGRVIDDLLAERGLSEFDGCKVLKELMDAHLVQVMEPETLPERNDEFGFEGSEPAFRETAYDEPAYDQPAYDQPDLASDEPHLESEVEEWPVAGSPYDALEAAIAEVGAEPYLDYSTQAVVEDPYIVGTYGEPASYEEVTPPAQPAAATDQPAVAIDGLADRGPWTSGELADIGVWDQGAGGGEGADDPEPEPEAPEEQPINRGLLLKFLSSVRD